ncbi:MAG: hypothetical protein AAGF20_09825 [Pseudomonadota bacterium]
MKRHDFSFGIPVELPGAVIDDLTTEALFAIIRIGRPESGGVRWAR